MARRPEEAVLGRGPDCDHREDSEREAITMDKWRLTLENVMYWATNLAKLFEDEARQGSAQRS